jgi:membrane protein YdbS with pleckstrin-like domain
MNSSAISPTDSVFHARFNPLIRTYLLFNVGFLLVVSIIGIPFAILWFLGVGQWWARHYFAKLECSLSGKALRFRKGILVSVEKTIPLENIQDVTFIEGPILKYFHLSEIKFETAGQSAGQAHDMRLIGIIDAHEFRNRIFAARDALKHPPAPAALSAPAEAFETRAYNPVVEQLVVLQAIQRSLDEILALLKAKK